MHKQLWNEMPALMRNCSRSLDMHAHILPGALHQLPWGKMRALMRNFSSPCRMAIGAKRFVPDALESSMILLCLRHSVG